MTFSGAACEMACITAFQARDVESIRARTGAGWFGFSRQPFGAVTVIGRSEPSLNGMSGLVSAALRQETLAEITEAKGELMLVLTCGAVPAKSTVMESPATVTAAFTASGPLPSPSSSRQASP